MVKKIESHRKVDGGLLLSKRRYKSCRSFKDQVDSDNASAELDQLLKRQEKLGGHQEPMVVCDAAPDTIPPKMITIVKFENNFCKKSF